MFRELSVFNKGFLLFLQVLKVSGAQTFLGLTTLQSQYLEGLVLVSVLGISKIARTSKLSHQ